VEVIIAYLLDKKRSAHLVLRKKGVLPWFIFFLSSVESCGGDHGISSREEEVCPFSPKNGRSMTMVIFFLSSVESCGGDHGTSSRERRSALLFLRKTGAKASPAQNPRQGHPRS